MNQSLSTAYQFIQRHRFESVGALLALVVAGVVVVLDFSRTNREVERLYTDSVNGLTQISELQNQVQETRRLALYGLTSTDSNVQLQSADATRAVEKQAAERIAGQRPILEEMGQGTVWNRLQTNWTAYLKVRDEVLAMVLEGDPKAAIAQDLKEAAPRYERLRDDLALIKQLHLDRAKAQLGEVRSLLRRSIYKIVALFTLYLLGASVAVHVLRRGALAMRESEARFRGVVESLGEGILITDAEDRILLGNKRMSELAGWSGGELLGRKVAELLMPPEEAARRPERNAQRFQGVSEQYESRLLRQDGRKIWVSVYSTPFRDAGGNITGVLGAYTDITEQKQATKNLARLNEQFAKAQRQAGMAEVATSVLHNVGNVLNSVNVSASLLRESLVNSKISSLLKATNMLRDHAADTAEFLSHDPKGKLLPGFLVKLGDNLAAQQLAWQQEVEGLSKNIEHIKEIVAMQQSYARLSGVTEALPAHELVEDALRMNDAGLGRHGIKLVRNYHSVPLISVDKHKLLQVLVNLIRNAKHAMEESSNSDKTMTLTVEAVGAQKVRIEVRDTSSGISPENLIRVFQLGFTTKKEGHGFGLHSGANAAKEMGGSLTVQSDGPGKGAAFTIELPAAGAAAGPPGSSQSQEA